MTRVFPDVRAAAIGALTDGLDGRPEPFVDGVAVQTKNPDDSYQAPVVQVAKDSDQVTYPITSRATIRITTWHKRDQDATDLASLCQGILLSHSGDTIEATQSLTGPVPGRDEDSGLFFATFTVAAVTHSQAS